MRIENINLPLNSVGKGQSVTMSAAKSNKIAMSKANGPLLARAKAKVKP